MKQNSFKEIVEILKELNKNYPNQGCAKHIHEATLDYKNNLWILNDDELLFALIKYKAELELNIIDDKEIDKIIKESTNLDNILFEEDNNELFDIDSENNWIN